LYIRTRFEMDFRSKMPGEFLKSQKAAAILSKIKDLTPVQRAASFVNIGIETKLTQKQWERVLRACKTVDGKSSLEPLERALRTVLWDEETDQIVERVEQETEKAKTFEEEIKEIEQVSKVLDEFSAAGLKKKAFRWLKENLDKLLTDGERETLTKLIDSVH
ncbi:MAG: hypothetical protein ACR2GD_12670, partial [Pyrinomonadaceae bacterium]